MGRKTVPIELRFWKQVDKKATSECWEWQGSKGGGGYGLSYYNGKRCGAHRVSYILANGEIPDGLDVCHKCDNPACVNPAHLWLGTPKENTADMFRKKRDNRAKGERRPEHKLTDETVRQIRIWIAEGISQRQIAKRLNVSQPAVCYVNTHKMWKHV